MKPWTKNPDPRTNQPENPDLRNITIENPNPTDTIEEKIKTET